MINDNCSNLYIVSTPIGNLKDITYRAVEVLSSVDLIASEDTRRTKILLDRYGIRKPLISYNDINKEKTTPKILKKLQEKSSIALVSDSGTPGISDPLYYLIKRVISEGIKIVPVPGASALLAGVVASGLPNDRFVFEGFIPAKKGRKKRLLQLKDEVRTIVLFESPHRLIKTLEDIRNFLGNRKISIAREITKVYEEFIRTDINSALNLFSEKKPRGEFVLIIEGKDK
ncbi:MAG: 16S rRNA (cytidine(1402)-2'-O)-methyltransferase [Candidatus Helarchaeota archaeon]|nr:16S rRNA (cytidine(1402)-2'-O)-methyltransferase [Candidatus Helarchaeota archaeon]